MLQPVIRLIHTDFCPSLNAYVYWLKEPVGWFVLALFCSSLIGAFFSPIGWSIAAGLAAVLVLGLGFPWLATRTIHCELLCECSELTEGEVTHLKLRVRNLLPMPVMGLIVENYFGVPMEDDATSPSAGVDAGLARVPALSTAEYRLRIQPEYRGRYPNGQPAIACGFPFGIYTARRPIASVKPVLVRPRVLPLLAECDFSGAKLAENGDGNRPSDQGDFLGVREFQRGDSLRSIHWVHSARFDELVVCEKGGPQKSPLSIRLSTARSLGSYLAARENLAWRVRIAASLIDMLSARHIPFDLWIDGRRLPIPTGSAAAKAAWDHLAVVPLDSPILETDLVTDPPTPGQLGFVIGAKELDDQYIRIDVGLSERTLRHDSTEGRHLMIDLDQSIDRQLERILQEASRDSAAA